MHVEETKRRLNAFNESFRCNRQKNQLTHNSSWFWWVQVFVPLDTSLRAGSLSSHARAATSREIRRRGKGSRFHARGYPIPYDLSTTSIWDYLVYFSVYWIETCGILLDARFFHEFTSTINHSWLTNQNARIDRFQYHAVKNNSKTIQWIKSRNRDPIENKWKRHFSKF